MTQIWYIKKLGAQEYWRDGPPGSWTGWTDSITSSLGFHSLQETVEYLQKMEESRKDEEDYTKKIDEGERIEIYSYIIM